MTMNSWPASRSADGGHDDGERRALRRYVLRAAVISGSLGLLAGASAGMAGAASAAPAPALAAPAVAAHRVAAPAVAAPAVAAHGHAPGMHPRSRLRGIITKVFAGRLVKVDGSRSRSRLTVREGTAFCPPGWVVTGGGYETPGHLVSVLASYPFPSHPWATPVAWVVLARHRWFGKGALLDLKPGWLRVFAVCAPGLHHKRFHPRPGGKRRHHRIPGPGAQPALRSGAAA
jgi:hypothetical protein